MLHDDSFNLPISLVCEQSSEHSVHGESEHVALGPRTTPSSLHVIEQG